MKMKMKMKMKMSSWVLNLALSISLCIVGRVFAKEKIHIHTPSYVYDQNYKIKYGHQHVLANDNGRQLQLSLDQSSGAGFQSKFYYGSGIFSMRMMLHNKDTAGVVTTFYLTSNKGDELDFEFLGNKEGKPIILQTNVYVDGVGLREQRMHLWFDPSKSFHTYKILWNSYQIVFFIDEVPVRVLKKNAKAGVAYPSRPMQITATIWDGSPWATDGGRTPIDWTHAPFKAYFRGFEIYGCPSGNMDCNSTKLWWNRGRYSRLNPEQEKAYEGVKSKYIYYDYCIDRRMHPIPPPECSH